MRHRKNFNHLGRKTAHRSAMLANMASSLILNKSITTTIAKAKALKMYVEPLITKSKNDTTHSRRIVFSYLQDKQTVSELFRDIAVKVSDRPGGYTRILKLGRRLGDNADMCIIELVDYNENMLESSKVKAKTTRRRRTKKSTTEVAAVDANIETAETSKPEATVEEPKVDQAKAEKSKIAKESKPKASVKKEVKVSKEDKKAE
ncbi:MAG: 50S ribosomal protein L17 [Bacteroidetes bacterium]|nr:50S ribosomal protein L17 [Bacteroidota bacterium]